VPLEIPDHYKNDFLEAVSLVEFSRRLLEKIFRDEFKLRQPNMAKEIEEFISLPDVPSYLR